MILGYALRVATWLVWVASAMVGWSVLIEPGLLVTRRADLALDGWPSSHPPLRVALVGDLHAGSPHIDLEKVHDIVERVNAENPDLVLLLGDYVIEGVIGGTPIEPEPIARTLGGLRARFGTVAVLGNHDWYGDGVRIERAFRSVGIQVLENRSIPVRLDSRRLVWIAGVADSSTRTPDLSAALADVDTPDPVIMLSHDPAVFLDSPDRVTLMVSGHTHGGQVRVPGIGALFVPGRSPLAWSYGHTRVAERHLYVTGGIGTSVLPVRFGVPPEIVVLTITHRSDDQRLQR